MEPYWEQNGHPPHPVKYESEAAVAGFPYCAESGLNFSTSTTAYSEDDTEYTPGRRGKASRQDPLSHRIIEKRRRDRMNSCLADLSRLIPPQYQRKGRGRIEKTEIIEMAIRHLKHLQNECVHKEIEYKLGYTDCMKEAAKFLYDSHMQEICYQMVTHLQDHCEEIMKNECYKTRCNAADTISASSGSPNLSQNYHTTAPLSQLRDMLTSDIEHSNSNDHNDVKDLSFRNHNNNNNNNNNNNQAPVIQSTVIPLSVHHHDTTSNHDFDTTSREPIIIQQHHENGIISSTSPPNNSDTITGTTNNNILRSVRMRNFSESSLHDIEQHNNNNYKYKNHIKQRFNQDSHNDESTSEHSINVNNLSENSNCTELQPNKATIIMNGGGSGGGGGDGRSNCINGGIDDISNCTINKKRKINNKNNNNTSEIHENGISNNYDNNNNNNDSKPTTNRLNDIKTESPTLHHHHHIKTNGLIGGGRHFAVPIFALHGQGTYYIPLNIDYETLLPYLNGIDLLDKNFCTMPILHPVNINVNFSPTSSSSTSSLPNGNIIRRERERERELVRPPKIEAIDKGW